MDYLGITIKRIAIGVQSSNSGSAPSDYWYPDHTATLPNEAALTEMLHRVKTRLAGKPTYVQIAVLFQVDRNEKQLNQSRPYSQPMQLRALLDAVINDCLLEAMRM